MPSLFKLFLRGAPYILAGLGVCLGVLGLLIDRYLPNSLVLYVWIGITCVLVFNGLILGSVVKRLSIKGYTDELTGLGNKSLFYLRLNLSVDRARSLSGHNMSLAMIDIDDFKKINDTYGHLAGDMVLKKMADIFTNNVRATDTVVRWGGEEFAIILPDANVDGALNLLERIRSLIASYDFGPEVQSTQITVSTGVVSYADLAKLIRKDDQDRTVDRFVELADKALYQAKSTKNKVIYYSGHNTLGA